MKKIILSLFFLIIARSLHASHIDWVDVSDKNSVYTESGYIDYHYISNIIDHESMYYEDQYEYNTFFGTYSIDQGELEPSLTTISFDTIIDISSIVKTNNFSGDVSFIFNTSLRAHDLDTKNTVYSNSSSQLLTHSLGSDDHLLLPWENSLYLTPDHQYAFSISIFLGSSNNSMLQQINALRNDVEGMAAATISWQGTTSVDFNSSPVPEPSTLLLLGIGLVGLTAVGRKKRN